MFMLRFSSRPLIMHNTAIIINNMIDKYDKMGYSLNKLFNWEYTYEEEEEEEED